MKKDKQATSWFNQLSPNQKEYVIRQHLKEQSLVAVSIDNETMEKEENQNVASNKDTSDFTTAMASLIGLVVTLFAVYLSLRCNSRFSFGSFLAAVCCSPFYIIYIWATKGFEYCLQNYPNNSAQAYYTARERGPEALEKYYKSINPQNVNLQMN